MGSILPHSKYLLFQGISAENGSNYYMDATVGIPTEIFDFDVYPSDDALVAHHPVPHDLE